jgi:hypothetical protein
MYGKAALGMLPQMAGLTAVSALEGAWGFARFLLQITGAAFALYGLIIGIVVLSCRRARQRQSEAQRARAETR